MIIETIVSTRSASGSVNFAPMGATFSSDGRVVFVVYHSTQTYRNLEANLSGVINLVSDVTLFVKTALYDFSPAHALSNHVEGGIMDLAEEAVEFEIDNIEPMEGKSKLSGHVVSRKTLKTPEAGLNRGRIAAIEALIAVTRIGVLDRMEIAQTMERSREIVNKTGGAKELEAMKLIEEVYEKAIDVDSEDSGKPGSKR